MVEHHGRGHDLRGGVRLVLTRNVGSGAVHGLEHGVFLADVRTRGNAQAADQARSQIACNVAIQVGEHHHVELRRVDDHVHAEGVDDAVVELNTALILLGNLARRAQEQAVGILHDVGFMSSGDLFAAMLQRVLEGVAHDVLGSRDGDRLDGDAGIGTDNARALVLAELDELRSRLRALFEFHACIQVLRVFANDDQVDVVVATARTGHGKHRTQAHVQVECFAKRNVDAAETGSNGSGARALDGNLVALHRLDGLIRQRSARFLGACRTGLSDFPNDVRTCSFHDLLHCSRRFQADAVARNQGYSMLCHCHSFCPAPQRIRVERNRLHRNAAQPEVPSLLSLNVVNDGLRLALQGTPAIMRIKRHTFNKCFLNVLRKLASGELRNSIQHVVELDIAVIALDGFVNERPDVLAALFGSGAIRAEEAHSSQAHKTVLLIE